MQYMGLPVFSLTISFVMKMRIGVSYLIFIMKSEVFISHCLGLGHATMVHAVCLSLFLYISH